MTPFLNTLFASISAAAPLCIFLTWVIRLIVRTENAAQLRELREEITAQLNRLDGIYMHSMGTDVSGAELARGISGARGELEKLKEDIKGETLYAHTRIHTINGELLKIQEWLKTLTK